MEIYNYRRVIFIISKFKLQFKFGTDNSVNTMQYACRSLLCLEVFCLSFFPHTSLKNDTRLQRHNLSGLFDDVINEFDCISFLIIPVKTVRYCTDNFDENYLFTTAVVLNGSTLTGTT